ncbi:hypothetical protein NW762_003582 [Fusarium torreyae]|uniref:Uncharacterized protein n=1 Tax=Fusarium torreyae TaxID=1237075 RepID=A0A9W8S920_9HYPO|nr:hypothetical protein NW762_003582 [Fusarium torreyae]
MLVAAPLPGPKIAKMKRNALAFLGYRTLVEEEQTLDILQGILVIMAWAQKCCVDTSQIVNLAFLALGYAHNLGITQYPPSAIPRTGYSEILSSAEKARQENTHSLEEQRALLGLYCVLSMQSRRNPLETRYVETCLKNIADAQAAPSDTAAAQVIRFIQMSEKLSRGFGEPHERTLSRPYAFLLEGTGRRFRSDLDRLAELTTHPDLASHYHTFELYHQYLLAARLLFIEAPDWDVLSTRESLNFGAVLNKMIARLEQTEQLRQGAMEAFDSSACNEGDANETSNISKLAQDIRWVNDWFEARLQGQPAEDMFPMENGRERTQDGTGPKWDIGLLEDMPWTL